MVPQTIVLPLNDSHPFVYFLGTAIRQLADPPLNDSHPDGVYDLTVLRAGIGPATKSLEGFCSIH